MSQFHRNNATLAKKKKKNAERVFSTHERNEKPPIHSVLTMDFLTVALILEERLAFSLLATEAYS